MPAPAPSGLHPLRPYQLDPIRAIIDSIREQRGDAFCLEFARQTGKNESSAQLELIVLTTLAEELSIAPDIIKVAPTLTPQAKLSRDRLKAVCRQAGVRGATSDGYIVSAGHGTARFLSAEPEANIAGHTANPLLEIDEAQDVDVDKFDKDVKPMASANNATTVFYGTAWSDFDLLAQARAAAIADEVRDGRRRSFIVDWTVLGDVSSQYKAFVLRERERLGARHPMFVTQYMMEQVAGGGRLLTPALVAQLQGDHARSRKRPGPALIAAGLDVSGGEGTSGKTDATVLSLGAVTAPSADDTPGNYLAVLDQHSWTNLPHDQLLPAVIDICKAWKVQRLAVDATGLGQTVGRLLASHLGPQIVELVTYTRPVKSQLGFDLQSSIATGRMKLWADDDSAEYAATMSQARLAKQDLLPGNYIAWYVDETDGHDDELNSLALLNRAAGSVEDRRARRRR